MLVGILSILNNLSVKNIVIGKQYKNSENYEQFIQIVKDKNIKVWIVEAGEKIQIQENLYFKILWPDSDNIITENNINNNSLVCKLQYKNFSMLFTGDIESIAEEKILEKYQQNLKELRATVLKVPHHGSKTSSTMSFVEVIRPQISLIGVGEKNTFGHPNKGVLDRLNSIHSKIYRTDKKGEITIHVSIKGKIKIKTQL